MKKPRIILLSVSGLLIAGLAIFFWSKKSREGKIEEPASSEEPKAGEVGSSEDHPVESVKGGEDNAPASSVAKTDDPKMKQIESVLHHSRVLEEFKAMDDLLNAQFEQIQDSARLSPEDQKELEGLKKLISSEALVAEYKDKLYKEFSEEELKHLDEIYQDPLIAQYKEAQIKNQTPEGQKEILENWKKFNEKDIPADRLEQIRLTDKNTGATKNAVSMMKDMNSAMTPENMRNDPKAQKAQESMLKSIETSLTKANAAVIDSNTKHMSVDEMKAQNGLMGSPVYQKEIGVKQSVLSGAMHKVAAKTNEATHRKVEEKKASEGR